MGAQTLQREGQDASTLWAVGFRAFTLRDAGYSAHDLAMSGYRANHLRWAGASEEVLTKAARSSCCSECRNRVGRRGSWITTGQLGDALHSRCPRAMQALEHASLSCLLKTDKDKD